MRLEEFLALKIPRGAYICVLWLDAASVYKRRKGAMTDDDVITEDEVVGVFEELRVVEKYPDEPHLIIYEGEKVDPLSPRGEKAHLYACIPLSLVREVRVLKRPRRATKHGEGRVYCVIVKEGTTKQYFRVKLR